MDSVTIPGRMMPVEYLVGAGGGALDQAALFAGLQEAAALINSVGTWTGDEREALSAMNKIVFFSGEIVVNTWKLTRPGCDEDDAIFYWEAVEFMANTDADVRANTFFHDCWHVIQFRRDGGFAQTTRSGSSVRSMRSAGRSKRPANWGASTARSRICRSTSTNMC
jgi:hypothetical protein